MLGSKMFYHRIMGVDHGGRGDKSPQNLERGHCPPKFCHVAKF